MEQLHQSGDLVTERYEILGILGQGSSGTTYSAKELHTNKKVALKALSFRHISDWKVLDLFEREAKVLAQLNHPAIPDYLDYFQTDTPTDRVFYIAQELVEGISLASLIAEGWHGTEQDIKDIAVQVLEVLVYLHKLKPPVIHRDIKPANLIRRNDGKIMVVDFGAVQAQYQNTRISGSTVVGTYGYMAPEQFRGKAVPATDLYGLGATLIFLLTGRSPADLPQTKLKIDFQQAVDISPEFADWLDQMLEPDVEERFSSAQSALQVLLGQKVATKALPIFRQPKGSRIKLEKTSSRLVVDIPPNGLKGETLSLLIISLFLNFFLVTWTALAFKGGGWFAFLAIPFWLVGIGFSSLTINTIFVHSRLDINRRTFQLTKGMFGFKRQFKGETEEIHVTELKTSYTVNNSPVMELILKYGVYSYKFGLGLTRVEQEWLVREINNFLGELRQRST